MKTGRATEAHMYHQAFQRSCRANASVREGRHSGVRGCLLALQLSSMPSACTRQWRTEKGITLPKMGRVKVLMYFSVRSTWGRIYSVALSQIRVCLERLEGGESGI